MKAIKATDPHTRPEKVKRAPAPDFHTVDRDVLRDPRQEYRQFEDRYNRLSKAVRAATDNEWKFPGNCYPPAPGYVSWEQAPELEVPEVRPRGDPSPSPEPVTIAPAVEAPTWPIKIKDDAHPA